MCKTLLPLKSLVDADAWQICEQDETYILYFLPPTHLFQKRFLSTVNLTNLTTIILKYDNEVALTTF